MRYRKLIALFLTLALLLSTAVPALATEETSLAGDVDGNDQINILDAMMILNYITGNIVFSDGEFAATDVTEDGAVNILDVMAVIAIITGTSDNTILNGPVPYDIQTVDRSWTNSSGNVLVYNAYELVVLSPSACYTDAINAGIRSDMEEFFSRDLRDEYSEEWLEWIMDMYNMDYGTLHYNATTTVTQNGNGIFSARITTNWFMGGVYNADYYGYTFDLTTGQKATLSGLMGMSDPAAQTKLENIVIDYVYDTYGDYVQSAPEDVLENYALEDYVFYVEEGQIMLCFPTYTFVDGASGSTVIPTGITI